jgi:hypothetical protein
MAEFVFADPYELSLLSTAIQTQMSAGTFGVAKLFQNDYIPQPGSTIANFTEATFDGYVSVVCKFVSGPYRWSDGTYGPWQNFDFPMTGSTTPNVIYGVFLEDPTGALIGALRFDVPVNMHDSHSICDFLLGITLGQGVINTQLVFTG